MIAGFAATPRSPRVAVYDLAELLAVAERSSPREVVLFGTPAGEKHLAEGFYRETAAGRLDGFVWARREAILSLTLPVPADRVAVLDVAPYAGAGEQSADVFLNESPVGHVGLRDGRQRVRLTLPAAAQKAGENRLRFVFAAARAPADLEPGNTDRRELAAAFHTLVLADAADAGAEDLLRRDAPAPFAAEAGVPPAIVQVGPSSLRYAVKLPGGATLRFTPSLEPGARAAAARVRLAVRLETEKGKTRELWSGTLGIDREPSGEVAVRLPGEAGAIAAVTLQVEGDRFAWVRWSAPRITGAPMEPLLLGRPPVDAGPRTTALRERLAKSNVLFVIFDAGRADRFSAYGHTKPTSPQVDRIADEGTVFLNATTPAVYTLGAMSSVWTSQHPDRHHSEVSFSARLPADRLTLAQVLSGRAIRNAGFVANIVSGRAFGFDRGFEHFVEVHEKHGSEADAFMQEVPEWLARNRDQRFFLYVHFREPHYPYDPPPDLAGKFGGATGPITPEARRRDDWIHDLNQGRRQPLPGEIEQLRGLFDGNLAYADRELGRLRAEMERLGTWDDTVVVVAADHGEELFEHGWIGHNVYVYQPSIHVPLIVKLPKGLGTPGRRTGELADLLDIAPTIADVFGVLGQGGTDREFQGRSLLPVLAGERGGKPALLSRSVWDRPRYALRDQRYKLIYDSRTGEAKLYDLQEDAAEARDVASVHRLRAAWMLQELQHWISRAGTRTSAGPAEKPTPEQCERLKALGYTNEGCAPAH